MMFKRLEITNFGVFSEPQSINLQTTRSTQQSRPLIIFGGKNGTGKTTLLEAVKMCLYGSSFKGRRMPKAEYKKYLRQRLHRNLDGSRALFAAVSVEFDYARAGYVDDFLIRRSWKWTDSDIVETLEIQQNNESLKDVNEEQWQDFLMELIPPGLSKLFFFDGEKIQSLARGQGENQHIMDSINSLLGIDLVEHLRYDIKMYCIKESNNQEVDLPERISEIETRKKSIELHLDSVLQQRASLQNKIVRVSSEIENQELRISTEGGGFASKREQLKNEAKKLDERIEQVKEEIRGLCASTLPFAYVPELCIILKRRLEREEKEQQREATLAYLSTAINDLTRDIGNTLLLDALRLSAEERQLVANETVKALRNRIEKMNGNGKESIHNVSSIERHDILRWIETALNQTPPRLQERSMRLKMLESEKETIEGYIFNAPADDVLKPLFEKLGQLHEELGMLQQQFATLEKESDDAKYQHTLVTRELTNTLNEKSQYDKTSERLNLATRTQDVLEEYLQRLRDEKVNEFRDNFLQCFNFLFSKRGFVHSVNVDATSFDITLLTSNGALISKAELSAGERQVYAMAMIWALAKTSGRQLPFIIDTPLARLDTEHRSNIMKSFLINASHQVIIFSTNTEIDQPYFDRLQPYISKAYNLKYNPEKGETEIKEGYFWKTLSDGVLDELQQN